MLNPNAQKLVDALRSGEYKQTHGVLRDGDTFCCLGVACDLSAEDIAGGWDGDTFDAGLRNRDSVTLPRSVQAWIGFTDASGSYLTTNLADENDSGKTFEEIADIIESEPEGLFA